MFFNKLSGHIVQFVIVLGRVVASGDIFPFVTGCVSHLN